MFQELQKKQQEDARKAQVEMGRICRRIFVDVLGDELINGQAVTIGQIAVILGMCQDYINQKGASIVYRDIEKKEGENAPRQ